MYFRPHVLCLAAAMISGGLAIAQNPPSSQPPSQAPQTPHGQGQPSPTAGGDVQPMATDPLAGDKRFIKQASEDSMIEVELGKLAAEKGSSDAVKQFGQRMVDDHGKVGKLVEQLAGAGKIEVATEMPRKGKKAQEKLAKLSGAEFDREYAKTMAKGHKKNVKAYEKQAKSGQIPEVKEFASKVLPSLQEHQKLAQQLEVSTKNGAAPASGSSE